MPSSQFQKHSLYLGSGTVFSSWNLYFFPHTIYFRGIFRSPPAAKRKSDQYPSNYELAPIWPPLKCNFSWLLPSKSIFVPFQCPGEVRRYLDPVISYGRCCTQNLSSHGTHHPQPRPKRCSQLYTGVNGVLSWSGQPKCIKIWLWCLTDIFLWVWKQQLSLW